MSKYPFKIEANSNENQSYDTDASWIVGYKDADGDFVPIVGFYTEAEARTHSATLTRVMEQVTKSLAIDFASLTVRASSGILGDANG